MASNETKRIKKITDLGTIIQAVYADLAAVIRTAESGLNYTILGALGSAVRVSENTPVMVFNSAGGIGYVSFGDQAMAAPTGPADGIPVPAGAAIIINSGSSAWVRGSAATIFGYKGDSLG